MVLSHFSWSPSYQQKEGVLSNLLILVLSRCSRDSSGMELDFIYSFTFEQLIQILDLKRCEDGML